MTGITSTGIGSGLDISSLVDKLVSAEQTPTQNRLDQQEAQVQAELSAYGSLKSALSSFQSQVQGLSQAADFQLFQATSSDPSAVTVSASASAAVGSLDLDVSQLAQSQSVATNAFATSATPIGTGTLTFRFGTVTTDASGNVTGFTQNPDKADVTIDISASNNSLQGIRDAVNNANAGVSASIVNDGSGERLVFSATDTGADNAFVIGVSDNDGNDADASGLSQLAFNTSATQAQQIRAAQDAQLTVNGLAVSRASNEITDLIDGVSLSLKGTTTSTAHIAVTQDTGAVKQKIQGFVDAFNKLQQQIDQISGYNAQTKTGGVLQGNATVLRIASSLQRLTTSVVSVLDGRAIRSLADLGVTTAADGTLSVDSTKLDAALKSHFDEVGALFGISGLVDGSGLSYAGSSDTTQAGEYAVDVTGLAQQASIQGAAITAPSASSPLVIDSNNDTLQLTVDGVASNSINLTQGSYTSGADLAAEIQARINGDSNLKDAGVSVDVAYSGNAFTITSARYGSDSTLSIGSVDTNTTSSLGLSSGQSGTGVDVQGTIAGQAASGSGRYLTAQNGPADGLKVEVTGQSTGTLGSLTFSRGLTDSLNSLLDSYLNSNGLLDSVTSSLNDQVKSIGEDKNNLTLRMEQVRQRYLDEFNSMDAMVAQLNSTSSFLSSQLPGLENLAKSAGK